MQGARRSAHEGADTKADGPQQRQDTADGRALVGASCTELVGFETALVVEHEDADRAVSAHVGLHESFGHAVGGGLIGIDSEYELPVGHGLTSIGRVGACVMTLTVARMGARRITRFGLLEAPGSTLATWTVGSLNDRGPGMRRALEVLQIGWADLHHPRHVGHPAAATAAVLLGRLGHDGLGGQDVLGDRGRVLQRRARDHGRVDDAVGHEVDDLARGGVQAEALLRLADVVDHDRALQTGVLGDLTERLLERAEHDARAGALVIVLERVGVDRGGGLQQRDAATGHDALLERRAGRLEGVLDAVLLLLHLRLGGRADLHDGHAARQLGEALLELLAVEVGVGVLDLGLDLVDAALDGVAVTGAVDDRRRVLGHDDATGAAQLRDLRVLELEAHLLGDDLAAGQDGDVLEHALAAIAEARGLDGHARERAAQLVHDERREGLALDVLGDDQQRLARLDGLLEDREDVPDRADLLVGDEDVRILEDRLHALLVGDHVGRDVALVELHALGELEVHAERLALLDVHDAVLADLLDGVGDDVADVLVAGRDRRDASDLLLARDLLGLLADVLDDLVDRELDAALEAERVGARRDVLQALANDRLGEDGRGRRAVAGDVVGRRGDLADELRALVLEDVLDLDLTSDGHAVVRDGRGAELLVEDDVAAARAERHLDGVGDHVDTLLEGVAGVNVVLELLVSHMSPVLLLLDLGQDVGLAQDQQVLAVDLDLGPAVLAVEDGVALRDVERDALVAVIVEAAVADGDDLAALRLLLGGVGEDEAAGSRLLLLDRPHDEPIAQRLELHGVDEPP